MGSASAQGAASEFFAAARGALQNQLGLRWNLPWSDLEPYLTASYQLALARDRPVQQASASSLDSYLAAQGSGQEFQSLWTVGVGVSF